MQSSKDALAQSRDNTHGRWKGSDEGARERIQKKIVVPVGRQSFTAKQGDTFFAMGSCFARNVEERLEMAGADVLSRKIEMDNLGATAARELGVFNKYNPYSILQELEFACGNREFTDACLLPAGGELFYDAQLRVSSGNASKDALLARRKQIQRFFAQAFEADVFILTLGLIEAWYDTQTGLYLNEAPSPKLLVRDRDRFQFHVLSVAECHEVLERIYTLLKTHSKDGQRIVMTVSPVPLGRTFTSDDVIVANTTSKSTLRVAGLEFISKHDDVDYFPSYEAVLHSHPDLAWQVDRLHVSDFMVGQIIRTFLTRYGFALIDEEESLSHKISPEEKIIRQLTRDLNRYKNLSIKMESLLKNAGLSIDEVEPKKA